MYTNFGEVHVHWPISLSWTLVGLKKFMQVGFPILVSVGFWEILLPPKLAKFPFPTMDYSPWVSKNLINQN